MDLRVFNIALSLLALAILLIPITLIGLFIKLTSKGPILYWSKRVGKNNIIFEMPKFRTMKVGTPVLATHLLENPNQYLIFFGSTLRRLSLDELPQLWSILMGKMSFVGPRPALFNQFDLITLRTSHGIHKLLPGLTGWAQVNGRDELSIESKIDYEIQYLRRRSLYFDAYILGLTLMRVIRCTGVRH